ncbi:MAG: GNAT family N-acetyltransferase [Phycisphaerae bacterium]
MLLSYLLTFIVFLCPLVDARRGDSKADQDRKGKSVTAWDSSFVPPSPPSNDVFVLEPLSPQHAELDHAAVMGSRKHIRHTLQWGNWPADDMTVEKNRKDLARHLKEYEKREAYAYTVLSKDRKRCLGCVYLYPVPKKSDAVRMAYWVIESELKNQIDQRLQQTVLDWIKADWPLKLVVLGFHTNNERGIDFAKKAGARQMGPVRENQIRFVWKAAN